MRAERIVMPCRDKSHSSRKSHWSYSFLFALLAAAPAWSAQPAARKPLPETAVLDRVDGRIIHVDANDTWLFELTMEVKTPQYQLSAGTRFVLLPSSTLARLAADVNDRAAPRYRLSARVTLYKGKNYLFPAYYLPLSKFKSDQKPETGGQKTEDGGQKTATPTEPELAVPPEILEHLKKQRPAREPRKSAEARKSAAQIPPERMLADCVGRIESAPRSPDQDAQNAWVKNRLYVFVPYGLGWNVSNVRYGLLPSAALEEVLQRQAASSDPIRFNVAGLVAEFQGKKYLLLQRAAVVYSYGNFGR